MSFTCNSTPSVPQEVSDTPCLQENKGLKTDCAPHFTFVTVNKEENINEWVDYYNGKLQEATKQNVRKESSKYNLEETKQIFISDVSVKQEPDLHYKTENLEEYQQDPLTVNDMKVGTVKKEFPLIDEVKEEFPMGTQEKQNNEDIKCNNDIVYFNRDCPEMINTSDRNVSTDNIPSASSHGKEKALVQGEKECVRQLEDKQSVEDNKLVTKRYLGVAYTKEKLPNIFQCSYCSKNFSTKCNLKVHVNSLHKKIRFECNQCHKMFSQATNLKTHINNVHKGIKKYKCNECHKMFSHSSSLKVHTNVTHKGIKSFQCNECGILFSVSGHLNIHIKTVHRGIRSFECNICHKTFGRSPNLKTHINALHKRNSNV